MELCSMLCGSLDGRKVWERKDTYTCMAESLKLSQFNQLYPNTKYNNHYSLKKSYKIDGEIYHVHGLEESMMGK